MGRNRKAAPNATRARVLISCRRKCCLCWHYDGNESQQDGQIAHLDHDCRNASEDNLVYLCFKHHSRYDCTPGQSPKIMPEEVRHARHELLRHLQDSSTTAVLIVFRIRGVASSFTREDASKFLTFLKNFCPRGSEIRLEAINPGSICLTVRTGPEDAIRLMAALDAGKLERADVLDAEVSHVCERSVPGDGEHMPRVFVSYSREDSGFVGKLVKSLRNARIAVFYDKDLQPGEHFLTRLEEEIRTADYFVPVLSPHYVASSMAMRESYGAILEEDDRRKGGSDAGMVVPILVDETPIPLFLRTIQYRDFRLDYRHSLAQLIAVLRKPRKRPEVPPSSMTRRRKRPSESDEELVNLALTICEDVCQERESRFETPEARKEYSRNAQGNQVRWIDVFCTARAKATARRWNADHDCEVTVIGEDVSLAASESLPKPILCCVDTLDGTEHWLRNRNLYATCVSLFRKSSSSRGLYRLRVSAVMDADRRICIAREDLKKAYWGKHVALHELTTIGSDVTSMKDAHVCTVARRASHYRVLVKHLESGSPFLGLYTFGGNPVLASLAFGDYDAVFQPDLESVGECQPIWDWLPGGHVAYRAGCCLKSPDGSDLNIVQKAEKWVNGHPQSCPYIAALNPKLAREIASWLKRTGPRPTGRHS